MSTALFLIGLLLGAAPLLPAQQIAVDSESVIARFALRPATQAVAVQTPGLYASSMARQRLSRGEATGLGFLAGAGAGLVIAHIVNQNKRTGEGKLENYIGIPLGLGLFTAATVFVAMGD